MIKRVLFFLCFSFFSCGAEIENSQVLPNSEAGQKGQALVTSMGQEAIHSLTGAELSETERHEYFRSLLRKYFHLQSIAKFVMGKAWKTMGSAQQERLLKVLDHHIASLYANRFAKYNPNNQFKVLSGSVNEQGKITVKSQLNQPNTAPVLIEWVIYEKDGELKVYDVLVEGVSMATTQRADYGSALERVGYNIENFLGNLEDKVKLFL